MKIRAILAFCLGLVLALGACFDSLVNDSCSAGFAWSKGACVAPLRDDAGAGDGSTPPDGVRLDARLDDGGAPSDTGPAGDGGPDPTGDAHVDGMPGGGSDAAPDAAPDAMIDAGVDAMVDATPDATVDAPVCTLPAVDCSGLCIDTTSDADNCGACNHVCPTGVCINSACAGALPGHIVAIGHDYRSHHAAMARVLGNSVALGAHFDVGIARLRGTAAADSAAGVSAAISRSMETLGRPWHRVTLPSTPTPTALVGIDVLVVDAQLGDGAAAEAMGTSWRANLTAFLGRGGVVIVLEGGSGVSYRFAIGGNLYTIGAPVDATGELALVTDGTDATTQQVASPYLAETTSVALPGPQRAVIAALISGGTLVFHLTR